MKNSIIPESIVLETDDAIEYKGVESLNSKIIPESISPEIYGVYSYRKPPSYNRTITLNPKRPNVTGTSGNDTFIANQGNYTIDGGNGNDTIDYSRIGQGVTIGAKGIITKGSLGIDTIKSVERIIGTVGKTNTIDGTGASGTKTSLNVDLDQRKFTLENLSSGNPLSFTVDNFSNVIGTSNNDIIKGDNGNNTISGGAGDDIFIGTKGNDTYDGGAGIDTLDYSKLSEGVTITAKGVIEKGILGTDRAINVEKIIGATGKTNTIDGTAANGTTASLNVNLATNTFTVQNLPGGVPNQVFDILNFSDVIGTNNNDIVVGSISGSRLTGGGGDDSILGNTGKDIINGTNSTARGIGEVDTLFGGGGVNTFVLGDSMGAFYLGNGDRDYAFIKDYDLTSDRIQLGAGKMNPIRYQVENTGIIDVFLGQSNGTEDLIAKVQLKNSFSLYGKSAMGMSTPMSAGINDNDGIAIGVAPTSLESQFTNTIFA